MSEQRTDLSPPRFLLALAVLGLFAGRLVAAPEPPSPEALLEDSIAYHDPDGVWGRLPLALELLESRPDGSERSTRLRFDPGAGTFELERRDAGKVMVGRIAPGECSWNLAAGNFSAEEVGGLDCARLERMRNYYDYLWGLPMKLRDSGTLLGPVSRVEVDGDARWRLRVTYEPEVGSDVWDLDFDPESGALTGYRFFHDEAKGDGEWIRLEGQVAGAGLRLPRDRSWYTNSEDEFLGRDRLVAVEELASTRRRAEALPTGEETASARPARTRPAWTLLATGGEASLRGLSALDAERAWVSGSDGTVLSTADGGATWERLAIPGAESLDFRDVELFEDGAAVLMTAGQPARLYRVEADGAVTLAHESPHETAFFDAVAFWDSQRGLAFSDPVEGRFLVLSTRDGGRSWRELDAAALPPPLSGEAGFAASGSNLAVGAGGRAWIGTGGGVARVLRSADFGASWQVAQAPMRRAEPTSGIFSIAFRDALRGVAAGGDYQDPRSTESTLVRSADGGATWTPAAVPPPSGHRAAVRFAPGRAAPAWISVGRAGSDYSIDGGLTWRRFSQTGFYTLAVGRDGSVWAAGSDGRVGRLEWVAAAD